MAMLTKYITVFIVFLVSTDATLGVFLYSIGLNNYSYAFTIPGVFAIFLLGSCNFNTIKLRRTDLFILSIIAFSALHSAYGLFSGNKLIKPEYILFDIISPLSFVAVSSSGKLPSIISTKTLNMIVSFLVSSSVLGALIFLLFGANSYQGITLPVNLPISFALACFIINISSQTSINFRPILLVIACILCALISGKRSYLLSDILVFIYSSIPLLIGQLKIVCFSGFVKIKTLLVLIILFLSLSLTIVPIFFSNQESKLSSSIDNALTLIQSERIAIDDSIISRLSAGRSDEIASLIPLFISNPINILIGFGPGFTYEYRNELNSISEDSYRNIHFSPLNLMAKYGLLFPILFYYQYLIRPPFKAFSYIARFSSRSAVLKSSLNLSKYADSDISSEVYLTSVFFIFISLIQSFFAFTLFVDPLLPIVNSIYRKTESQIEP